MEEGKGDREYWEEGLWALLILWSKCSDIKWNMKEVREEKLSSRGNSQCEGPNMGV